jgi:pyruvate dehydrogenase E1 component beta subunit
MDFMVLATDQIVNQAAKWRHMLAGRSPAVTIRGIINRGGEQGAQHSQALHAWYSHIPGLRVVMPATPQDARDLLIGAVLCDDPVVYIDDRWLYELSEEMPPAKRVDLIRIRPEVRRVGRDITLAAAGFSVKLALDAADELAESNISAEVIDMRVVNPLDSRLIGDSVRKTGRLLAIDGGWRTCGLAGELIACVVEALPPSALRTAPRRITLPDAPAPTSKALEQIYYPSSAVVAAAGKEMVNTSP